MWSGYGSFDRTEANRIEQDKCFGLMKQVVPVASISARGSQKDV